MQSNERPREFYSAALLRERGSKRIVDDATSFTWRHTVEFAGKKFKVKLSLNDPKIAPIRYTRSAPIATTLMHVEQGILTANYELVERETRLEWFLRSVSQQIAFLPLIGLHSANQRIAYFEYKKPRRSSQPILRDDLDLAKSYHHANVFPSQADAVGRIEAIAAALKG